MRSLRWLSIALLVCGTARATGVRWRQLSSSGSPGARVGAGLAHLAVTSQKGMVLVGGCTVAFCNFGDDPQHVAASDAFQLRNDAWQPLALSALDVSVPRRRWLHAMASVGGIGSVLVMGGLSDADPWTLGDTAELAAAHDGAPYWASWVTAPRARDLAAMAEGPDGDMLYGGNDQNQGSSEVWHWNGSQWQPVTLDGDPQPAGRWGHAFAYDFARTEFVMFGGDNVGADDPVWTLACETSTYCTWTAHPQTGSPKPSPADGARLAFMPALGQVVLFGGKWSGSGDTYPSDLWAWDGDQFQTVTARGGAPAGRWMHAMARDPDAQRIVLYGGGNPSPLADTWVLEVAPADGGTQDAGTLDAGTHDAGTHDAGTHDAGTETFDAGSPEGDDAGSPADDAGTVGGTDAGDQGPDDGETTPDPLSRYGCTTVPAGALVLLALISRRRAKRCDRGGSPDRAARASPRPCRAP